MAEQKTLTPPGAHPALLAASDYGLACNQMARHKLGTPEYEAAYQQCNAAWERIAAALGVMVDRNQTFSQDQPPGESKAKD